MESSSAVKASKDPIGAIPAAGPRTRTVELGPVGDMAATGPGVTLRIVSCRCLEEWLCVGCLPLRRRGLETFAWADRALMPDLEADALPNPLGHEDFARAAARFIAGTRPLPGQVSPFDAQIRKHRKILALQVLLGVFAAGATITSFATKNVSMSLFILFLLAAAVALVVTIVNIVRHTDGALLAVYARSAFMADSLPTLLSRPETPNQHRRIALAYLLGELSIRMSEQAAIHLVHTDHPLSTSSDSLPHNLAEAARTLGANLNIEVAVLSNDVANAYWKNLHGVQPTRVPFDDWKSDAGHASVEVDLLAKRFGVPEACASQVLYLTRTAPVFGAPLALDAAAAFITDPEQASLIAAYDHTLTWREKARNAWSRHRHAVLSRGIEDASLHFKTFTAELLWLLAAFPERAFEASALLTFWPAGEPTFPNAEQFTKIIAALTDKRLIVEEFHRVRLAPGLDPDLLRRRIAHDVNKMYKGVLKAFWDLLSADDEPSIRHGLRLVGSLPAPEAFTKMSVEIVVSRLVDRARAEEVKGPIAEAIPWWRRAADMGRAHGAPDDTVVAAERREATLRAWTARTPDAIPVTEPTVFWRLWRHYLRGERDAIAAPLDAAIVAQAPWLPVAQRALLRAHEFDRAGGWLAKVAERALDVLDVVGTRADLESALAAPELPRSLRSFCFHLMLATGELEPALTPDERQAIVSRWREFLAGWQRPESHPHSKGWWSANQARVAFWDARIARAANDRGRPTGSADELVKRVADALNAFLGSHRLFDQAEAILVERLGIEWAAYELAVDSCYARIIERGFSVVDPAQQIARISELENRLTEARELRAVAGRLAIYEELIHLHTLFNVPRAIELCDEAIAFARQHADESAVQSLQLRRAPIVFNAVGLADRRERYLEEEAEISAWLERRLTTISEGHRDRIRAHLVQSYSTAASLIAAPGGPLRQYGTAAELFEKADAHLEAMAKGTTLHARSEVVRLVLGLNHHKGTSEQRLKDCDRIIERCEALLAHAGDSAEIAFNLAQAVLQRIDLRMSLGRAGEFQAATVSDLRRSYAHARGESNVDGGWKYVRARLAHALAAHEPAASYTWPADSALSDEARQAFVEIAAAETRLGLLDDCFRQYCDLAEFGLAIIAARDLQMLHESVPGLAGAGDLERAEEMCRKLLQTPQQASHEFIFHATHVLYHLVVGRPYFDNAREQYYAEARYHLENGHETEAQERFARIVTLCMEDPEALPLDYDNDAFKRRIRYLAQAQQTEEAELLEQHRREVIYRGACSAFLLIAEDLIKRNLRPQAETYIQWVIDRGSSKQRQRAEALA